MSCARFSLGGFGSESPAEEEIPVPTRGMFLEFVAWVLLFRQMEEAYSYAMSDASPLWVGGETLNVAQLSSLSA
jgi:hypothetical protein